jgi:hypothetical protein
MPFGGSDGGDRRPSDGCDMFKGADGRDESDKKGRSGDSAYLLYQLCKGEPACSFDDDEEGKLFFGCLNLGDVDVEVADRIGFEIMLSRFVAFSVRQAVDAVPPQATMATRAGEGLSTPTHGGDHRAAGACAGGARRQSPGSQPRVIQPLGGHH